MCKCVPTTYVSVCVLHLNTLENPRKFHSAFVPHCFIAFVQQVLPFISAQQALSVCSGKLPFAMEPHKPQLLDFHITLKLFNAISMGCSQLANFHL